MHDASEALSIDAIQKADASAKFLVCGLTLCRLQIWSLHVVAPEVTTCSDCGQASWSLHVVTFYATMQAARVRATTGPSCAGGRRTDRAQGAPWATAYTRRTVRPHPRAVRAHHTVCRSLLTSFLRSAGRSRTLVLTCCRKPERRRSVGWRQSGAVRGSALGCRGEAPWPSPCPKPHAWMPVPPSKAGCGERKPLAMQEAPFAFEPNCSDTFSIPAVASQSPAGVGYTERAPGRRWCEWYGPCPTDHPA